MAGDKTGNGVWNDVGKATIWEASSWGNALIVDGMMQACEDYVENTACSVVGWLLPSYTEASQRDN